MAKRDALRFLLAFLLVAGQQLALVHSVWHLSGFAPVQKRSDEVRASKHHQNHGQSQQSRLCDLHAALGNLLAGDCGSLPVVSAATEPHGPVAYTAAWHAAQPATTPPSRAPPVLL